MRSLKALGSGPGLVAEPDGTRPRVRITEPRTRVGHVEYDFVEHQIITLRGDDFGRRWVDREVEPEVMQYYPELLAETRFNLDWPSTRLSVRP